MKNGADMSHSLSKKELAQIKSYRQVCIENCNNQTNLLDKSIISISGASFTIAIGFINKIIPMETATYKSTFWLAIVSLAITILSTVYSFEFSSKVSQKMRKACDDAISEQSYELLAKTKTKWNFALHVMNILRLVFFTIGLSLLAFFIGYNGYNISYL